MFTMITVFFGIYFILFLSEKLSRIMFAARMFAQCSKSSLYILAFHIFVGNDLVYPLLKTVFRVSWLIDLLSYAVTIALCVFIHYLVGKIPVIRYLCLPYYATTKRNRGYGIPV